MKIALLFVAPIWTLLVGCSTSQPVVQGTVQAVPLPQVYTGHSRHISMVREGTNLREKYGEPPRATGDKRDILFDLNAEHYLEGVKGDLELIESYAENAQMKIDAVVRAASSPNLRFSRPRHVGSPYLIGLLSNTNIKYAGYYEFSEFKYQLPSEPLYNDEFSILKYKWDLLDYLATMEAYVEDGRKYLRNCARDYELVRNNGREFLEYLETRRSP